MRIFLAGIEMDNATTQAIVEAKVPNVLTSFFYCGYQNKTVYPEWINALKQAEVRFIDSGAFTLRTSWKSNSADVLVPDYDDYLEKYISWLKVLDSMGLATIWAEVDIGTLLSHEWVVRQREKMILRGLGHGLVNVWHSDMDWAEWLYLLKEAKQPGRSNYVAIEGYTAGREPLNYAKYLKAAYDRGVKVHGFKMTGADVMRNLPFYSIDSSNWKAPIRYNQKPYLHRSGGVGLTQSLQREPGQIQSWKGCIPKKGNGPEFRCKVLVEAVKLYMTAERQITETWKQRGVDWDTAIANPKVLV